MTWFKLDDQFPRHPKVLRAGTDAAWLFVAGGCYCAQYLTDGMIPKSAVPGLTALRNPTKLAEALVEAGLWHDKGDEWEVHDYLLYNPSRAHVDGERQKKSVAGAKGAANRWNGKANSKPMAGAIAEGIGCSDAPVPVPTTTTPQPPASGGLREAGTNPRAQGTNPRGAREPTAQEIRDADLATQRAAAEMTYAKNAARAAAIDADPGIAPPTDLLARLRGREPDGTVSDLQTEADRRGPRVPDATGTRGENADEERTGTE